MPESYRDQLEFREALDQLEEGVERGAAQAPRSGRRAQAEEHASVAALVEALGQEVVLHHEVQAGDEHVVFVAPERAYEVLEWLKREQAYDLLADLTAVDYGGGRPIQLVYQLWSIAERRALRLKTELPLDALEAESVVPLWHAANWMEREVYDMFGVDFRGHPDLRRILMPENYAEGHPLRKDFPLRGRFSRAEQTRRALSMDTEDFYIPDELDVYERGEGDRREPPGEVRRLSGSGAASGAHPGVAIPPMRPEGAPGVPDSRGGPDAGGAGTDPSGAQHPGEQRPAEAQRSSEEEAEAEKEKGA